MDSCSENIEKVILSGNMEMEPMDSSKDDKINVENDDTIRTLEKLNDATNEPMILSEQVETEPMKSLNDGAIDVDNGGVMHVLSELNGRKLSDYIKESVENLINRFDQRFVETRENIDELVDRVDNVEDSTFANDELRKQAFLRNNIWIFGVPSFDGENLMDIFLAMANVKSVHVLPQDVREIFRVNGRDGSSIVVKFNSMSVKLKFLRSKSIFLKDIFNSNLIRDANEKIIIRKAVTPHFKNMLRISHSAVRDGRLKKALLTSKGLALTFLDGTIQNSIIFIDELESIIEGLPKPLKKPRRNRCRSPRAKQMKKLSCKNRRRGGHRHQRRNKNHLKTQNRGIFRTKRFLIVFFFFFFQKTDTAKIQMGNSRQLEFG